MTHEELSELYELYALGVLAPEDKSELDEHLSRNCPQCRSGVQRALSLGAFLSTLPERVEPPSRLRRRVLASVGLEARTSRGWLGALAFVSACLLIGVVLLSLEATRGKEELASARDQVRRNVTDLARMQSVLDFLNEPESRQVLFGTGQPQPPRGRVFVNPRRGVLLIASNLPQAPSGKIYEMWLIPKTGGPVPAGLFQTDARGNAVYLRGQSLDLASTKAVAVTLEPESGSSAPTSTPVIAASVSD